MRLDLASLNISALKNFAANQHVDLPSYGVTAIVGKNEDDGGSNGTGKSSFSIAALVNLFGPKYVGASIKDLENRYLKDSARVVGRYYLDGKELLVDRTLGGRLWFMFDGKPNRDGKAEEVQVQLNQILGITPEQLDFLSNKSQGQFGGFLLMKDADKKDFLSSFFDVTDIEKAKDKADLELSVKTKELNAATGKLQYVEGEVKRLADLVNSAKIEVERVNTSDFRKTIDAMKLQLSDLEANKSALESLKNKSESEFAEYAMAIAEVKSAYEASMLKRANIEAQIAEQNARMEETKLKIEELNLKIYNTPSTPKELLDQKAQIEAVIAELNRRKNSVAQQQYAHSLSLQRLVNLQTSLEQAENAKCSYCESPLSDEKKAATKAKIQADIDATRASDSLILEKIAAETVNEDDVKQAQVFKDTILQKIADFSAANNPETFKRESALVRETQKVITSTILQLRMALDMESGAVKQAIQKVRDGINSALTKINYDIYNAQLGIQAKEAEIADKLKELSRAEAEHKRVCEEFAQVFRSKEALDEEVTTLTHVTKVTSKAGFIGYIFDSMLENFNSEINENLKMIPNARKFSLQFSSDRLVKTTGAVNKAITYQIFSGTEKVDFETLSGGEKLSVIAAVDESLDTVLSKRLGVSIGWKFLDEQFYWIDENSKESILNFYKAKSSKRAYFIVDHASEFNAAFDSKITIVRSNNVARFAS